MSAKPLVGLEPLPHEAGAPVVEETPRPTLASVVPEVAERLLQQASGVEPLVGSQQQRKRALAVQAEIVAMRQQRVLLALDEAPILAAQARVFGFAHLVEDLAVVLAEARSKFADMAPGELESLIDEAAAAARKGSARW